MTSTITIGSNSITVVSLPASPGLGSVEFSSTDAVAIVTSPFTGQTQAQQWLGADSLSGTCTLPSLTQDQADNWISFLMECRGMANAFMLGDPLKTTPRGAVSGLPVVDVAGAASPMTPGGQSLYVRGLTPSRARVLLPGDCLQVGYRLHRNLDVVSTDATGRAVISVWPSLRDAPTDAEAVIVNNPRGLFRLAANKRTWSADFTRLTKLSFQIQEYR